MKQILCGFLLLVVAGCVHSYAERAERVRAGVIGLRGRDLRACLPVPSVHVDGDWEYQTYHWTPPEDEPLEPPWEREEASRPEDFDAEWPIQVGGGRPRRSRDDPSHPIDDDWPLSARVREREQVAYCELEIALRDGIVRGVQSEGRNRDGLDTSTRCLLELRRCLPEGR